MYCLSFSLYTSLMHLHSFPTRRSSDLHKDQLMKSAFPANKGKVEISRFKGLGEMPARYLKDTTMDPKKRALLRVKLPPKGDRKSTRLNSSHMSISYAVFCLKKKKSKTE